MHCWVIVTFWLFTCLMRDYLRGRFQAQQLPVCSGVSSFRERNQLCTPIRRFALRRSLHFPFDRTVVGAKGVNKVLW